MVPIKEFRPSDIVRVKKGTGMKSLNSISSDGETRIDKAVTVLILRA